MKRFIGASDDFANSKVVLIGVPFDSTSSFRAGSRFGPEYIRIFSDSIETFSPYQRKDLCEIKFFDGGDVEVAPGNVEITLNNIYSFIKEKILKKKKIPFLIGGEHLITYASVKAVKERYKKITIIHLDAHTDLKDEYCGVKFSHATVMKRIYELKKINLIQLGIRSGTFNEFEFMKKNKTFFNFSMIDKINEKIKNEKVYLTIDVDVFDHSIIPGVGNPEPGGINFSQFLSFLFNLDLKNLVGIDVVELSPSIDPTNNSTIAVSVIIRELLLSIY